MELQINIFTTDLVWVGVVDAVESLLHRTSWHEIPSSEMTVSKTAQGVEELQIGRILLVNNQLDKALIIEDLSASLDNEYIQFILIPLKGMLNYRICHPIDSKTFLQKNQSEVMAFLTGNNLNNQTRDLDRKFWNSTETQNLFAVATVRNLGDLIDFTPDWKTGYLGDAIVSISKMYSLGKFPIGWNVYITDTYTFYRMDCYEAVNKSINQTINPPVVFSEEFGNIKDATYEYSIKDWRNVAYMIWEDANGVLKETPVGNKTLGDTISFNRKEIIIDSSKKTSTEVANEGKSELNKRPHLETFTGEIIDNKNTMSTYKEDWNLGDIVTIQSKGIFQDKLISIDAQVTQIEELYANGEYSINATFGEGRLSIFQLIKQAIEQKK
jgi:hypothetical protein